MSLLLISNIVLWITVLLLGALVFALARQIGVLHERIAPVGALALDSGPKVGDAAPLLDLTTLAGSLIALGRARERGLLLFFLSPTCPVCKKLLPVLRALRSSEAGTVDIVLASDGETDEHRRFVAEQRLDAFPYVLSAELGLGFRIGKLPYAVLLDAEGRVRAKGLVNTREQIESLLVARDMGVASIQEYRARQAANKEQAA
jgi:methylamine dehydrogenase accessory protein MauD